MRGYDYKRRCCGLRLIQINFTASVAALLYPQLLYKISGRLSLYEQGNSKLFITGIKCTYCILQRSLTAFMNYDKIFRRIGCKKFLNNLSSLYFAAIVGVTENIEFEIFCEPCRKFFNITLPQIFKNKNKNIIR